VTVPSQHAYMLHCEDKSLSGIDNCLVASWQFKGGLGTYGDRIETLTRF
jgi:hypothetical protein